MIALFIVLFFCVGLMGCTEKNNPEYKDDTEKFVGTWNTSNPIQWYIKPSFIFLANGSFVVGNYGGTYIVNEGEGTLALHWRDGESIYTYSYLFSDNNTLSLTYLENEDNGIYKRQ